MKIINIAKIERLNEDDLKSLFVEAVEGYLCCNISEKHPRINRAYLRESFRKLQDE